MKTSVVLLITAPALFILAMNSPFGGDPGILVLLSYASAVAGIYWGLTRGTPAARRAVALSAISLALFWLSVAFAPSHSILMLAKPPLIAVPNLEPVLATAATIFLVLAVIQWIRAFRTGDPRSIPADPGRTG